MILTTKGTSYNDLHCCILKSSGNTKYNVKSKDMAVLYMGVVLSTWYSIFKFFSAN